MYNILEYSNIDRVVWDKFVYDSSYGWLHHTSDFMKMNSHLGENKSFAIMCGDEILAIYVLYGNFYNKKKYFGLVEKKYGNLFSIGGFCIKDNLSKKQFKKVTSLFKTYIDNMISESGIKSFNTMMLYAPALLPQKTNWLTYNFGSEVTKIEILEQDDWHDTKIIVPFDYLFYRSFVVKESKYKHNSDVFNFYSFSKDEWKNIFNNLFKNDKVLESFFNIIVQNHLEKTISEYHLERYIDCIASIGKTKQYNKTKYQDVLKDFIRDFDSDIQKALISFFKKSLRTVKANPSKDDWVLIGQKIANLRALTTHFDESSKPVNMAKYTNLYFIFELVVIDYIFEVLDISKDKRLSYKEKYIKPFLK